jgi:outer membrane biosynthesis protein TonB
MRLRIPVSLSLLLLARQAVCAQPADEFFHSGAQSYLSNNVARARQDVDNGLKLYPDDLKLKKLDELLKQQSQSQSKNDQQKQDQEKKDQQQAKQDQKDQQKQGEKPSQEQKDKPKQEQPQKSSGEKKEQQDGQEQSEPSQPMQAHAMTPQEAKQLLDAQKGEEQVLLFRPQGEPKNRERTLKDW